MANIRVDAPKTISDGFELVFYAPCDCSEITGLTVYYPVGVNIIQNKTFIFKDAHGNNVGDLDNLFTEGVYVKVILNVTEGVAYIQNADTNKYLEDRLKMLSEMLVI